MTKLAKLTNLKDLVKMVKMVKFAMQIFIGQNPYLATINYERLMQKLEWQNVFRD